MAIVALISLLAWQAQPRLGPGPYAKPTRRAPEPALQAAGSAAAAQAMKMLGQMGMQAAAEAKPGEPPPLKEFVAAVRITHNRVIEAEEGGTVPDYMRLPVDQYAIYDERLMRKLPSVEGGDGEVFELSLPTMRPQPGTYVPKPKVRVRVRPQPDRISLQSIDASLFGGTEDELPPNMTSANLEQLKSLFDLALNTTLAWSDTKQRSASDGATTLQCVTDVQLKISLPPPFTRAPRPLVQGAIGLVMRFVGNAILPRFASLLETDYQRWCNGTRELTNGLGSLALDADGYLIVPDEVLKKMKSAPVGSTASVEDPQPQLES